MWKSGTFLELGGAPGRSIGNGQDAFAQLFFMAAPRCGRLSSAVLDRGLDVVLHIGTPANSSLVMKRIGWARAFTCASPAYLRAWGVPLHPNDLARHRAVIYGRPDEDSNTTWTFVRGGERCSVDVPVSLVTRDGIGLTDGVLGGCGIARPFDVAVGHLLAAGELKTVLEPWQGTRYSVSAILPPGTRNPSSK
jgi:LysR family transcriptional regulator, regulator for bpeEF and oprC